MARVLVVDDDAMVRLTITQILEDVGFEVIEAENGEVGLNQLNEHGADLVITDIIMPKKEGIETIVEARENHPDIKIIAISGGGRINSTDYLQAALDLGADQIVAKPLDTEKLVHAIHEVLAPKTETVV